MNLLYKTKSKNDELKRAIAKARTLNLSCSFKYQSTEEKALDFAKLLGVDLPMARKVRWVMDGDCARQIEIKKKYGVEYAKYDTN